jgi:hypothetical protein
MQNFVECAEPWLEAAGAAATAWLTRTCAHADLADYARSLARVSRLTPRLA